MRNPAKAMTDTFLNVLLMHGFRDTDEKLMDAFDNSPNFDPFVFDAAYDVLIEDVQKYVKPLKG